MPLFIGRWPNGDSSGVLAPTRDEALIELDQVGNAEEVLPAYARPTPADQHVYVQAMRWQSVVGRPDVQAFYGALAGRRANKGVFTSSFSPQAMEFAGSVERIVLADGAKLAELMIEHEVGVASRAVGVPKIDSDYFEE